MKILDKTEYYVVNKNLEIARTALHNIVEFFNQANMDGFKSSYERYLEDVILTKTLIEEFIEFQFGEKK